MGQGTDFLKEAVENSIVRIENEKNHAGVCPSHGSIADGMHTLLLCKRLELDRVGKLSGAMVLALSLLSGVISAAVAVITVCLGK
jgi:hypothetical protein